MSSSSSAPPSPPVLIVKSLAIPALLSAIACYQLQEPLNAFASFFFAASLLDQTAVLGLIFALLLGVLSLALSLTLDDSHSSKKAMVDPFVATPLPAKTSNNTATIVYPLQALANAKTDKERLDCMYPMLRDELLAHLRDCNELTEEAVDWCQAMMDYTVPGGKLNRGTTVLAVLRTLQGGHLTELQTAQAAVCGWSLELLQAFFLVADDVMDDSKTRRGQPCWFRQPHVGLVAINDSFLLESFVLTVLKRHFYQASLLVVDNATERVRLQTLYASLLDLMMDTIQKTEVGQLLDLTSQPANGKMDLTRFTLERYQSIVKYKTAFYSFYLPTAMGMLLSGIADAQAYRLAQDITIQMGEYFQIQDDYLDCFGDPAVIGKIGTDIQENKCSWLVVQALDKCPVDSTDKVAKQGRKVLEQHYGQWNDGKVAKVKQLYKELDLPAVFAKYEEASYQELQTKIAQAAHVMPTAVFEELLHKIYKRSK